MDKTKFTERRRKAAEAAFLSRMGTAILKKRLLVAWISEMENALGYTSMEQPITVHVAWKFDSFKDIMEKKYEPVLRMGVFAHELLHQKLTDFGYTNRIANSFKTRGEAAIFMNFMNTLEDPAIEYFAPNVFGSELLESLWFSISIIYKNSPGIDESGSAYQQLINALIDFGDMGIVKGKFTFPESEKYFKLIAPKYNEGITCPDARKRVDIAKECMDMCRPLWEEELKNREAMEKLMDELAKALAKYGSPDEDEMPSIPSEKNGTAKRRDKLIKKIEEGKKSEKASKDSGKSDKKEEGKEEKDGTSDPKASDSDSAEETSSEFTSDNEGAGNSTDKDDDFESTKDDSGDNSEKEDSDDNSKKRNRRHYGEDAELVDPANSETDDADIDYIIDDDVLDAIEESIKSEARESERREREEGAEKSETPLPDFDISSSAFHDVNCLNRRPQIDTDRISSVYMNFVGDYSWEIKTLEKSLEKLFKADQEELRRATSGEYNIHRGTIGCTAKIFDKKKDPGKTKDVAVCLCVDQSGSMYCEDRMEQARKAAIVLAESLTKLKVPYYIMGFSADGAGYDVIHNHFVTWDNRKKDRETLAGMSPDGNNFDGYSIRYAAKLLSQRRESKKLLFVVSDGEPACCAYSRSDGIADTVNAIKDARRVGTVFGIAVGSGCDQSVLQSMYGRDFIAVTDGQFLTNVLGKKLLKSMKH